MERTELVQVMALVSGYWPAWTPNDVTMLAAERQLLDLPQAQVVAALDVIAAEGVEFAPGPGAIRKRAIELHSPAPGVDEAWGEVCEQIREVGHAARPAWSHEAVASAVRAMGGWQALCSSTNPEADRAHFIRMYGVGVTRLASERAMPPATREAIAEMAGGIFKRLEAGDG